jgi:hypothetical protein
MDDAAEKPENKTVVRLSNLTYNQLNKSFMIGRLNSFKTKHRNWDLKLLDRQLEDIYKDMLYVSEKNIQPLGIRGFIHNFIGTFEQCDENVDNVLSLKEFITCMKNDTFLSKLTVPTAQPFPTNTYVPRKNYTNASYFYEQIFLLLDENLNNYLNFHDYMKLRLMVFFLETLFGPRTFYRGDQLRMCD